MWQRSKDIGAALLRTVRMTGRACFAALRGGRRPSLPISLRLTLLHTAILFCILLLSSVFVLGGASYILYRSVEDDIRLSRTNAVQYLRQGHDIMRLPEQENVLLPGIALQIRDASGRSLWSGISVEGRMKELVGEDHVLGRIQGDRLQVLRDKKNYYYNKIYSIEQDGKTYELIFSRKMSEEKRFLQILFKLLVVTDLTGLAIAMGSGIFLSRRTLRPLQEIMRTAKHIEVKDLGARITPGENRDELYELAMILNRMMDRIQTGFEQQRRFVSDASHELRTPTTIISGYADMLSRWGKNDPQVLDESIGAIRSEAENMSRIIEELLFLARADQGRQIVKKSEFSLRELLAEIVRETRLIAPEYTIRFQAETDTKLYADAAAIKQMVRIFIDNGLKYTPEGGVITVGCAEESAAPFLFVEDTGIGIALQEQPRLFERFYRVDGSRSKDTGGTGLGLAIAKWIADAHQAQIDLRSAPKEGTRIMVRFPAP